MRNIKTILLLCLTALLSCNSKKITTDNMISRGVNSDPTYFPIAVWLQNPSDAIDYKSYGINMYVGIHGGLDQNKFDLLKDADMNVIAHQNEFGRNNLSEPLIYAWMHGDEPDNAQWNPDKNKYDPCIDPTKIIEDYNELKLSDPTRPVYLNLGRGVAVNDWIGRGECTSNIDMYKISHNGYLKGCDIASFDIYPVNSNEKEVKENLWYIAKGIDNLLEWSEYSKPVWCWIETTRIGDEGFGSRKPTPEEVKAQVWMAIIHGASGIGYFCHSFVEPSDPAALLHDEVMISAIKEVNMQITELAPVLNSSTITDYIEITSSNTEIPIDFITKRIGETFYVFAVSMRRGNTTATFKIKDEKKVYVLGENREIKFGEDKIFIDQFSDYEVHIYKITN